MIIAYANTHTFYSLMQAILSYSLWAEFVALELLLWLNSYFLTDLLLYLWRVLKQPLCIPFGCRPFTSEGD